MTSPKLLGAAALLASALAMPAFAQNFPPGHPCAGPSPDPACRNVIGDRAMDSRYRRPRVAYRQAYPDDRPRTGFAPLDAAGAVAGAAVGTAAAVATAPFRNPNESYAYYDRGGPAWHGDWDSYAARNGIVCRPGTWFKGEDGRRHLCQ